MNAPACATAYSSLSITIHHRAGKQFAEGREISPRRCGAAFAVGGPARRAPGSRPAARHPCGVKIPGSVGAPPCLTAARSACAGSFLGDAPARRLLWPPCRWRLPARGKLVRPMPARAVPEALRAERSASAERAAGGPLRGMRTDRLWSAAVVRPARTGSAGPATSGQVLVQDGADGGCGPGGVPAVPGGPADQPGGGPVADQRPGPGPRD